MARPKSRLEEKNWLCIEGGKPAGAPSTLVVSFPPMKIRDLIEFEPEVAARRALDLLSSSSGDRIGRLEYRNQVICPEEEIATKEPGDLECAFGRTIAECASYQPAFQDETRRASYRNRWTAIANAAAVLLDIPAAGFLYSYFPSDGTAFEKLLGVALGAAAIATIHLAATEFSALKSGPKTDDDRRRARYAEAANRFIELESAMHKDLKIAAPFLSDYRAVVN
jgi:hypothetical protein